MGNGDVKITRRCMTEAACKAVAGPNAKTNFACEKHGGGDMTCRQCMCGILGADFDCPLAPSGKQNQTIIIYIIVQLRMYCAFENKFVIGQL